MFHLRYIMKNQHHQLLPKQERILKELGENLRLARLRRKLSAQQVAERAGIGRTTLHLLENGSAGTSMGRLVAVLSVLGLQGDLQKVGLDDILGRKLEDARLSETRRRAPKKSTKR